MRIAFYLNLQGAGHCRRFESIARHFPKGCELAVVGMDGPPQLKNLNRPVECVSVPGYAPPPTTDFMRQQTSHDYHDFLVNYGDNSAFTMAMVSFLTRWRPDLVVSDVGLEASILARMCGIPVIYSRQHGERWDKGHTLAYEWACALIAPFSEEMEQSSCPDWIKAKTFYSGGFCRFSGQEPSIAPPDCYADDRPNVLVMTGFGGTDITPQKIAAAAAANPQWQWHLLGKHSVSHTALQGVRCHGVVEDVWPYLCRADLVVANAGHNSVMEIGAAGVPSVIIPAARPFAEQTCKADVLERLNLSVVSQQWPAPEEWTVLWQKSRDLDLSKWTQLQGRQEPAKAAQYITQLTRKCLRPSESVRRLHASKRSFANAS